MKVLRGFTRLYIALYVLWVFALAGYAYLRAGSLRSSYQYELSKNFDEETSALFGVDTQDIKVALSAERTVTLQVPSSWLKEEIGMYIRNAQIEKLELFKPENISERKTQPDQGAKGKKSAKAQIEAVIGRPLEEMEAKTTLTDAARQLRTLLFEQRRIALTRQRDEMTYPRYLLSSLATWEGWTLILFVPLGLFLFSVATGYSLRWIYRGFAGK